MGQRLHTAVKYEIDYGTQAKFNWKANYVNPIIDILSENDCSFDGDDINYALAITANRVNLLANIDKIIKPSEQWEWQDDLDEALSRLQYDECEPMTKEYLHEHLKKLIEQSDSRHEYVYFFWF